MNGAAGWRCGRRSVPWPAGIHLSVRLRRPSPARSPTRPPMEVYDFMGGRVGEREGTARRTDPQVRSQTDTKARRKHAGADGATASDRTLAARRQRDIAEHRGLESGATAWRMPARTGLWPLRIRQELGQALSSVRRRLRRADPRMQSLFADVASAGAQRRYCHRQWPYPRSSGRIRQHLRFYAPILKITTNVSDLTEMLKSVHSRMCGVESVIFCFFFAG